MQTKLPVQLHSGLSEEHLRDLLIAAGETSDIIIFLNAQCNITWVNNSFTKTYGYDAQQVSGISLAAFLENNQASKIKVDEIINALNEGKDYTGTVFLIHNQKRTPFWNDFKIKAIKDEQGKVLKFIAIVHDITEHIKKNEELLYSEFRWKFALEESGDGFFEYDLVNHRFFGSDNL